MRLEVERKKVVWDLDRSQVFGQRGTDQLNEEISRKKTVRSFK